MRFASYYTKSIFEQVHDYRTLHYFDISNIIEGAFLNLNNVQSFHASAISECPHIVSFNQELLPWPPVFSFFWTYMTFDPFVLGQFSNCFGPVELVLHLHRVNAEHCSPWSPQPRQLPRNVESSFKARIVGARITPAMKTCINNPGAVEDLIFFVAKAFQQQREQKDKKKDTVCVRASKCAINIHAKEALKQQKRKQQTFFLSILLLLVCVSLLLDNP